LAIKLKTPEQLEKMRAAGRVVREVLDRLGAMIAPGVTTADLDRTATEMCLERGAECLFKGVPGRAGAGPFPGAICASINEVVVHGIPSPHREIRDGDIVSVDFGARLNGWCGDAAETFMVGQVPDPVRRLVDATRRALETAVSMCRPGEKWSRIARTMQEAIEAEGLSVVRDFVGHGIGASMHEDPKVPNFVSDELERRDIVLREGLVLAVEPMVNMGRPAVEYAPDGWAVLTRDRLPSAHFEHTVAITSRGVDVLTR
jgi:methionyl aminopeptidase